MKTTTSSRIQRYLIRTAILLIMVALIVGTAGFDGARGSLLRPPYQNSPPQNLEIWTWYDLDAVRSNLGGNHTLMNDLDFTTAGYDELASRTANEGRGWDPIGFVETIFWDDMCGGGSYENWYGLNGTFDGQGYEIRYLFIDRLDESDVGLFRIVNEGGVIRNIAAVHVTVIGAYYVGSLVGRNRGTVSNSYSSGEVTGGQWGVGGLIGGLFETMESGGGAVDNSYSACDVFGNGAVGGLVGWNGFTVTNSYSTGDVGGSNDVGGLVGKNDGTVNNSFWDTETSGQATSSGGTGKTTGEMQDIATFSGAGWNIAAVALNETNPAYIWNIVNNATYPFLGWES